MPLWCHQVHSNRPQVSNYYTLQVRTRLLRSCPLINNYITTSVLLDCPSDQFIHPQVGIYSNLLPITMVLDRLLAITSAPLHSEDILDNEADILFTVFRRQPHSESLSAVQDFGRDADHAVF